MMTPLDRLRATLGHAFNDPGLLVQALTHRSCGSPHNERLEFLGDALLNLVAAEAVFTARAGADEGELSRLRAALVREETLAAAARRLQIGDALQLGPGELRSGGFRRDSILADAFEAILGAIYVDAGFDAARRACRQLLAPEFDALPSASVAKDAKTRLQEWLQAQARPLPEYQLIEESGPAHQRRFRVRCSLADDALAAEGQGSSRRLAEQDAAAGILAQTETA